MNASCFKCTLELLVTSLRCHPVIYKDIERCANVTKINNETNLLPSFMNWVLENIYPHPVYEKKNNNIENLKSKLRNILHIFNEYSSKLSRALKTKKA